MLTYAVGKELTQAQVFSMFEIYHKFFKSLHLVENQSSGDIGGV